MADEKQDQLTHNDDEDTETLTLDSGRTITVGFAANPESPDYVVISEDGGIGRVSEGQLSAGGPLRPENCTWYSQGPQKPGAEARALIVPVAMLPDVDRWVLETEGSEREDRQRVAALYRKLSAAFGTAH